MIEGLGLDGKALLLDRRDNENLARAAANHPRLTVIDALGVNVYDALNAGTIVFTEEALHAAFKSPEGKTLLADLPNFTSNINPIISVETQMLWP